jgi:hypothetical protein
MTNIILVLHDQYNDEIRVFADQIGHYLRRTSSVHTDVTLKDGSILYIQESIEVLDRVFTELHFMIKVPDSAEGKI